MTMRNAVAMTGQHIVNRALFPATQFGLRVQAIGGSNKALPRYGVVQSRNQR